ncbi:MAG: hypothetical protein P0120_18180 [Nitrospira sp.]|nr:hypothetical protein [Nitrospira sp.]
MDKRREAWNTVVERGKEDYKKGEETIRDAGVRPKEFASQRQNAVEEATNEPSRSHG